MNADVVIDVAGQPVHAIVTDEPVTDLGLKVGQAATALFKAGHVILGVAAP